MAYRDNTNMSTQSSSNNVIRLPVIDVSDPTQLVGRQMLDAATKYGFFYVDSRNLLDFTPEIVNHVFSLVRIQPFFKWIFLWTKLQVV